MLSQRIFCKLSFIRNSTSKHVYIGTSYYSLSSRKPFSTATTTATARAAKATNDFSSSPPKPFSAIPGNWRGSFPIIGGMPLFLPYVDKETGGMRTEDFMRDNYNDYGKETGLCRFGPPEKRCVLVFDERYLEVYKYESKYPKGILEDSWPIQQYNDRYLNGIQNPFTASGEDWRKGRMSINPYIFNIQAAQSYLDTITETAADAAKHFQEYAANGKLDRFCDLAAFDMFIAASLGLQLKSVGGDPRGIQFADEIIGCIGTMGKISTHCPYSRHDMFKFKAWDNFVKEWKVGRDASKELVKLALANGEGSGKGIMHGFLKNDRNSDADVSDEEATEMNLILTFAASETTSSLINNVLTNLSRNPRVQDKLREEIKRELGGADYYAGVKLKYFEQVLKESQRLTPPLPWINVKHDLPREITMGDYLIPKGTTVIFSHMGIANDETLAGPEPLKFYPERFSDEAIASRKGTRAEFLDHPLCNKPFGFGARMCVGSRIAKLEYTSLICRIIQDYKLEYDQVNNAAPATVRLSHTTTTEYPCPKFKVTKVTNN